MNRRLLLCTAACVLISGCAGTQDDFGFARKPQLKPGATARASKKQDKASDPPRILPETHYAAARVFEQQGSPEKAIEQYQKAVAVNHNFTAAYARLGLMLSVTGQHEEAIEAFAKAVELKPGSAILHNNLGFEYLYVERWDDAEQHLRQAAKLDPKLPQAHINLGLLLGRTERYELALESFRKVLPEPDANYNLGLLHRAQGRFALATESFQRVLTINPEFVAARKQITEIEGKVVKTPTSAPTPEVLATQHPTTPTLRPTPLSTEVQQPKDPTETGTTRIVDLQHLIDQMITDPVSAPPTHTLQPTGTEPTVHTIQQSIEVTTPTATTRTTEHNTLVVGMETIKPIEYFEEPKAHQFEPVTPTIAAEPIVTKPVVERNELTLKDVARAQNLAEQTVTEIIPVQTIVPTSAAFQPHDAVPTPSAVQNDEIILVLAESETREQPELVIDPVRPIEAAEPAAPANMSAYILDDMEVSLQVLRNEVRCMKDDEGTAVTSDSVGTEIVNITPVDQQTIAEITPWVGDDSVAGPIDSSMKTIPEADSNVARVPVTAIYEEPNTKVTAPEFGSTPPPTRASGKTSTKSRDRSRNRD